MAEGFRKYWCEGIQSRSKALLVWEGWLDPGADVTEVVPVLREGDGTRAQDSTGGKKWLGGRQSVAEETLCDKILVPRTSVVFKDSVA